MPDPDPAPPGDAHDDARVLKHPLIVAEPTKNWSEMTDEDLKCLAVAIVQSIDSRLNRDDGSERVEE